MKKFIIFVASLLLARENPFILPDQNLDTAQKNLIKKYVVQKKIVVESNETKPKQKPFVKNRLLDLGFLQILQQGNRLSIVTKDRVRKYFLINRPKKVVFDFKKRRFFKTKTIYAKVPFKKVTIGAHKTFYRVAIEVASNCKPKVDKYNLTIECR